MMWVMARGTAGADRRDIAAWAAVAVAAAASFVALAAGGRIPGADLPQHAIVVRRLLEGAGAGLGPYQFRFLSPYTAFYGLARGFAAFTDPVRAVWLATALAIALLPVASAALARSLGRSPALGCFALLGGFTVCTAWGFAPLILGAAAFGLVAAAAVSYARRASRARGMVLVVAIGFAYASHFLAWVLSVPAAAALISLRARRFRVRALWPVAVGLAATGAAAASWIASTEATELLRAQLATLHRSGPGPLERVADLLDTAVAYGRADPLRVPWRLLGALWLIVVVLALPAALRLARRARRHASRRQLVRLALRWAVAPAVALALLAAFLLAPLAAGGTYLVYPRFLLYLAVALPALVPGPRQRAVGMVAILALVPALWLALAVHRETRAYARATSCADALAAAARPGEALLVLAFTHAPPGYPLPVMRHIGAEVVARRGGTIGSYDVADLGVAALIYRRGWTRELPPWLDMPPIAYRHALHGAEYTAWLVVAPPVDPAQIVPPGPGMVATRCGAMFLLTDTSVAPGSRPAVRYLPHRVAP
jgi:hypothetical protein